MSEPTYHNTLVPVYLHMDKVMGLKGVGTSVERSPLPIALAMEIDKTVETDERYTNGEIEHKFAVVDFLDDLMRLYIPTQGFSEESSPSKESRCSIVVPYNVPQKFRARFFIKKKALTLMKAGKNIDLKLSDEDIVWVFLNYYIRMLASTLSSKTGTSVGDIKEFVRRNIRVYSISCNRSYFNGDTAELELVLQGYTFPSVRDVESLGALTMKMFCSQVKFLLPILSEPLAVFDRKAYWSLPFLLLNGFSHSRGVKKTEISEFQFLDLETMEDDQKHSTNNVFVLEGYKIPIRVDRDRSFMSTIELVTESLLKAENTVYEAARREYIIVEKKYLSLEKLDDEPDNEFAERKKTLIEALAKVKAVFDGFKPQIAADVSNWETRDDDLAAVYESIPLSFWTGNASSSSGNKYITVEPHVRMDSILG